MVLAASVLAVLLVTERTQADSGDISGTETEQADSGEIPVTETEQADFGETAARWASAAFDVVVLRPFYAVGTVVGAVLFVPAAVVTSPGGRPAIADAWETLVVTPADEAFKRPLGDF
jgi:hypothetical protein